MRKAFPSKSTASGGICGPSPLLLTPGDSRHPMSACRKGRTPAGARPADAVSHPALLSGTWSHVARTAQVSSALLLSSQGTVPVAQPLKSQPFLCASLCTPGLITPGKRGSFWPGLYFLTCLMSKYLPEFLQLGFPGGAVVENPPANAGDTGSSPGPGRSHMPQSN